VFEIGTSLKEARLRRGLDLTDAELATKIRSKYLRALEDESFDVLPAQTYVKGFLRSYAEYLGLDGQIYVDEYNSRYVSGDEETQFKPRRTSHVNRAHRRVESRGLALALTGIAAAAALVVVAWKWGGADEGRIPNLDSSRPPAAATRACTSERGSSWIGLQLAATRGGSHVTVYRGAPTGRLLFDGTLERGASRCFAGRRLWFQATRPEHLAARVNGRRVRLPQGSGGPLVALANARGIVRTSVS
jgi:cytoskeleton protein RodZ